MVRIAICDDDKTAVLLHENIVERIRVIMKNILIIDDDLDTGNVLEEIPKIELYNEKVRKIVCNAWLQPPVAEKKPYFGGVLLAKAVC